MRYIIILDGEVYGAQTLHVSDLIIASEWMAIDCLYDKYATETENGKLIWQNIPEKISI